MKTGLTSVTFRNLSTDEIIGIAASNGLDGIEWGADVHIKPGDYEKAKETYEKCKRNFLEVFSYGSYFRANGENYDQVLKTALALNAPVVRIWAGTKSPENCNEKEFDFVVQNIKKIAKKASEYGLIIALEYHRGTLTQTKESTYKLLKTIQMENVRCYWQPNPDISLSEHLEEINLLMPYILYYHVFYWEKGDIRCPISEAENQWIEYIKPAWENKKMPNLIIEFVQDNSIISFIDDVKALKKIINKLMERKV